MAASDFRGPTALPAYSDATLAALGPVELIALMVRDEDRVPRNVIDACAAHGERMVAALRLILNDGRPWADDSTSGEWWLTFHAAMILGLIPDEKAGHLLIDFMRRLDLEKDKDMQDWLAGWWAALFRNKSGNLVQPLRDLCAERSLGWYLRGDAVESAIALAELADSGTLAETLSWAAALAADETEDWDLRLSTGSALLDLAPIDHRHLLENLAARQNSPGAWFSMQEVEDAYASDGREAQWHRMNDPWEFYRPGHIARRRDRWEAEQRVEDQTDAYADSYVAPFVRDTPKVGRNDPCPCGSGKKYKKCCLTLANS